jgi:hypothetical protein
MAQELSARLLPRNRRLQSKEADRTFVFVGTSKAHAIQNWDRALCIPIAEARHPLLVGTIVMTRRVLGRVRPFEKWTPAECVGMRDDGRYVWAPVFDGATPDTIGEPVYVVRQIRRFLAE